MNDAENPLNVALDNSTFFKYKASLLGKATDADGNDRSLKKVKISCSTEIFISPFRSLEMQLINCKIHLELNWKNNCEVYGADTYAGGDNANNKETTFKRTSTKSYVPIVTLSTKYKINLTNQLHEGFKKSVYWNEYKPKIETQEADDNNLKIFSLDLLFKELLDCLFLLLTIQIMVLIELKETVIENMFSQE